jgi:hypothetical protein
MNGTGLIQSWNGNPLDVGPLYPFVGAEIFLLGLCVVGWIVWTVWQMRAETAGYEQQAEALRHPDALSRVIRQERE